MSKGKYQRKRQRAKEKAEREAEQIGLANGEMVGAEKRESSESAQEERHKEEKQSVGFREIIKRSSFTDWCLSVFTGGLVALGYFQYRTMDSQLNVMRNDERAWVEYINPPNELNGEHIHLQFTPGDPVTFPIKLRNAGKTPARNVKMDAFLEIVEAPREPSFDRVAHYSDYVHITLTTGMMIPGQDIDDKLVRMEHINSPLLATTGESLAIQEGRAYVAVYGIITYDDVFHAHHWTKFCSYFSNNTEMATSNAQQCTAYNNVDDE